MNSQIKVHFRDDGKGLQPIIAVKLIDSDDPRDSLLKAFFQALGGKSSWLSVDFDHNIINDERNATTFITIHPVRPEELKITADAMNRRIGSGVSNDNPIKDRYNP